MDGINEYTCKCPPEFSGKFCEIEPMVDQLYPQTSPCQHHDCKHGICFQPPGSNSYVCKCAPGYSGIAFWTSKPLPIKANLSLLLPLAWQSKTLSLFSTCRTPTLSLKWHWCELNVTCTSCLPHRNHRGNQVPSDCRQQYTYQIKDWLL